MLLGIDHLVIAVRDPDAAATTLGRALGLVFSGGGRHADAGTFNRLAFLGDTYLELIGVFDRGLVRSSPSFAVGGATLAVLDAGREGLATYALASDDVRDDVDRLRAAGSSIGEPVPGSRTRPDGGVVRWVTAFPPLGPEQPPFLIEHELRGAEWDDGARATRAAFRHPGGGRVRLASLAIPVRDRVGVAARYATILGLRFETDDRVQVGDQSIRLEDAGEPAGDGPRVPIADLLAEPGWPPLDIVRFGIRWRRTSGRA